MPLPPQSLYQVQLIPVEKIKPDPLQPRQTLDYKEIDGLALSLANSSVGLINAIEVDENYVIITGEQRWHAVKKAGFTEIPCKVIPGLSQDDRFMRQVIENIHKGTMNDWDIAKSFEKLLSLRTRCAVKKKMPDPEQDKHIRDLARELGIAESSIRAKLSILSMPEDVQEAARKGEISASVIREIRYAPGERLRKELTKRFLSGEIQTRNGVKEIVSALKRSPEKQEEILEQDYDGMTTADVIRTLNFIAPSDLEITREDMKEQEAGKTLWNAISRLENELDAWPPEKIADGLKPMVGIAIMSLVQNLNLYLQRAKQSGEALIEAPEVTQ